MREKTTSLRYQAEPHRSCREDVASGSLGNVRETTCIVLAVSRLSLKVSQQSWTVDVEESLCFRRCSMLPPFLQYL